MTFIEWMTELRGIAESMNADFLLSQDDEDHRESFDEGLSPQEEFEEQYVAAAQACT